MTLTAPPGPPTADEPGSNPAWVGALSRTTVGTCWSGAELTIMVSGELDAGSGTVLDAAMHGILATDSPEHVAIDLADLDFCDTAGVRALIRAHHLVTARGTHCRVTGAQQHVAWLLHVTGAGETLDCAG